MRTRLLLTSLLILAASGGVLTQQPTFPSGVELVTVDVVVFDRQGKPVEGLTGEDFVIREDGQPQKVAAFEAVSLLQTTAPPSRRLRVTTNDEQLDVAGRWFFVVFDDVHVTEISTPRAQETITNFIEQTLRPGDNVMIATSSGRSTWIGTLPEDRKELLAYAQSLQGQRRIETGPDRIWDYEAMGITLGRDPQAMAQVARRYFENGLIIEAELRSAEVRENFKDLAPGLQAIRIKARQTYDEARARLEVSLGMLERMANALEDARGRKTLLLFSDGFIVDTTLPVFRTLTQAAVNANVAVHFVDVRTPGGYIGQPGLLGGNAEVARAVQENDSIALGLAQREEEGTRAVASDTGGSVVTGTNLLPGLTRIAEQGRSYYLLGYSPVNKRRDGRFRKIDVTVSRRDVTVRSRGGYYEPTTERGVTRPSADKLNPAIRAALDSPFGTRGLPLRLTSYVFGAEKDGKVRTLLVSEADLRPLQLKPFQGKYSARLDSYVLVHDRDRDALNRDERIVEVELPAAIFEQTLRTGLPAQREFLLEPGLYQATMLLRDRATGLTGSVRHEFEVPSADRFRISTPVLTDTFQSAEGGRPARPVPIARRTFRAGSRIVSVFDVYGARPPAPGEMPRVSVSYSLRRADGTVVAGTQPQPVRAVPNGTITVTIGVTLPETASGDHELVLTIRDDAASATIEDRENIIITPRSG
jgi:VWFA-related protein